MSKIMDGAQNGIFCNVELKIEGNDKAPIGCASAKELCVPQFKKRSSPITHLHAPLKRPRIVEEMCSLPCGNKLCSKIMESPTGHQHYSQSNNLTGDPCATVSADTRHVSSSFISDENEDLDDSLLELEEKEGDGEDLMNLTSEEIDKILQESDDDVDNSHSLKFGDVSGIGDDALDEHKYSDNSHFSLSPPSTSQSPKNYLVVDELETSYLGDDLTADISVLKVDDEVNQSVKSEQQNLNSVHENTEIEKSEQPYYIAVDKVAVINPTQNGADVETDERDHIPSNNEAGPETQDKMLITVSPATSSNMLKEDNKSILLEQNISEEKADHGRVKEDTTIPGSCEGEVPDLKDTSEHKESVAESPKEMGPQKLKPAKTGSAHPETRQKTRLKSAFSKEIERQKRTYFKHVSNHMKESYKNQGPMQELQCLVDKVADRDYFSFPQHCSDLTTRNYMNRYMYRPKIHLNEWACRNGESPRFSEIERFLQRGPHP